MSLILRVVSPLSSKTISGLSKQTGVGGVVSSEQSSPVGWHSCDSETVRTPDAEKFEVHSSNPPNSTT